MNADPNCKCGREPALPSRESPRFGQPQVAEGHTPGPERVHTDPDESYCNDGFKELHRLDELADDEEGR